MQVNRLQISELLWFTLSHASPKSNFLPQSYLYHQNFIWRNLEASKDCQLSASIAWQHPSLLASKQMFKKSETTLKRHYHHVVQQSLSNSLHKIAAWRHAGAPKPSLPLRGDVQCSQQWPHGHHRTRRIGRIRIRSSWIARVWKSCFGCNYCTATSTRYLCKSNPSIIAWKLPRQVGAYPKQANLASHLPSAMPTPGG